MYKLNYDFKENNAYISNYIELLIKESKVNFQQQIRNAKVKNGKHDAEVLDDCIRTLEEFLYYNYKKSPETFKNVIITIINNVHTISVLPDNERNVYGYTNVKNKIIYINPNLSNSRYLTGEERTKLYMAHELGHIINSQWMGKVAEYANQQIIEGRWPQKQAQLIYDGFSMLDEVTTQNRAEIFIYELARKKRPGLSRYINKRMFNSEPYKSNFDYYGELQEPTTMFARTLSGIGKENDDLIALEMLSTRALLPNFFNNILDEYTKKGQRKELILIGQYMGLLKRASYANFGQADVLYLQYSKTYLEELKKLTAQVRDYGNAFNDRSGGKYTR